MTPNLYAAERCRTPLFNYKDCKWHVDFVENDKWTYKAFSDPEKAHKFYLEIFYKLEREYKAHEGKTR